MTKFSASVTLSSAVTFSWRDLLYKTERIYDGITGRWREEDEIHRHIDELIEVMRQQGVDVDMGETLDAKDQS